eukprot:UN20551
MIKATSKFSLRNPHINFSMEKIITHKEVELKEYL